jgi:DNA polymerase III subunit gamma/tau
LSLALYRKYRPASFAEVVGQEHVTEPLQQALRTGRVHHAYLFSGPRGCGKTSSARILARSLNCAQGPTPTPCGECDSCVALAPNGPGSLDVIEIDAASHGLVDDARDLRERAFFAPVSSPFKVYIVDEAHMISQAAFNALLKVVEEPPPHVKFIFATTEPDKVLSTIKSRTFHYRFRLIPPAVLREFLAGLCAREGIDVDPLVLPLVVRAGAGSARDALSVLDQLAAGADESGVSYERALSILGYTDAALLDETVDAFTAVDGAAVFRSVDRVIEAGLDPRRFAQDLLERFRDLLLLDAVADAGEAGLLDLPADELERMRGQAARLGRPALTRAADVMAQALVDMRGTTSPRLVLELACARILLPGASTDPAALLTRLDRLEKRLSVAPAADHVAPPRSEVPVPAETSAAGPAETSAATPEAPSAEEAAPPTSQPEIAGTVDVAALRRLWDDILDAVKQRSRSVHAMLTMHAHVAAVDDRTVTVAFKTTGVAGQFEKRTEFFREALLEVVGLDRTVKVVTGDDKGEATAESSSGSNTPAPAAQAGSEVVDLTDDEDDEPIPAGDSPADALALLESELSAQVIDRIDGS